VSRLRRRRLGCRCARPARAAPASTLARVTVWRGAAHVPLQAAAAWPLLRSLGAGCASSTLARVTVWREVAHVLPPAAAAWLLLLSLGAGCAGFYAGVRHGVARGGTCAASGGGGLAVAALARRGMRRLLRWRASRCGARRHVCRLRRSRLGRCCARSARAAPASTPARVTVWREAVTAWPLLRSLGAGCAGFYAGAHRAVARGGTCAASGGGGLAVAALAPRGLRRLLRWRASRCGARRHLCRLGR
jgi:hypothetical protein